MKVIFIIILLHGIMSVFSQEPKFIVLYNQGQYEKCLKIIENVIEKDKKNYLAYLYKSMSLSQISIKNAYTGGNEAERALKTLVQLKKKDKADSFLNNHPVEIEVVRNNTSQKADKLAENENFKDAIKINELLTVLFDGYIYYYKKGKCLVQMGSVAAGGDNFILAAKIIWNNYNTGIPVNADQEEIFTDLASLLNKYGFKNEAFVVLKRGVRLFPGGELVRNSYYEILALNNAALTVYTADSIFQKLLAETDTAISFYPFWESFLGLKYDISNNYLSYLVYKSDEIQLKKFMLKETILSVGKINEISWNKMKESLTGLVVSKMINHPGNIPLSTFASHFAAKMLIELYRVKTPNQTEEQIIKQLIGEEMKIGHLEVAGILIINFQDINNKNKKINPILDDFILKLTENKPAGFELWRELFYWKKIFTNHKILNDKFLNLTCSLADLYINKQYDFSKAQIILKEALAIYPENGQLKNLFKELVVKDYDINYKGTDVSLTELNWTGNSEGCLVGSISPTAILKTINRLNYYRRLAGIPDQCVFDEIYNRYAQHAAFLMNLNRKLSHSPDKTWLCYSDSAFTAARNSNLSFGNHTVYALDGQVEDGGVNNYFVGHRRWILFPYTKTYGMGSTANSMALWVLSKGDHYPDSLTKPYNEQFVAWPPNGYVPSTLIPNRWSFSLALVDFSNASITMYYEGVQIELKTEKINNGYGLPTLVWVPQNFKPDQKKETTIKIKIDHVKSKDKNQMRSFEYSVIIWPAQ